MISGKKIRVVEFSCQGAVIGGAILLLVGVGGLLLKREEAVEESEAVVTTREVMAEKTERRYDAKSGHFHIDIKAERKNQGLSSEVGDRVKDTIDAAGGLMEADGQK